MRDSVEWIVVRNPEPGTYRVKVLAHRVYTAPPRAAVAWTVIRGASTPTLSVEADQARITDAGTHELTLTLTSDAYVAAGTRLRIDCRTQGSSTCNELLTIERTTLVRDDGVAVNLEDEQGSATPAEYSRTAKPIDLGVPMPIGEVAAGDAGARQVALRVSVLRAPEAGEATLHFTAGAWNALGGSAAVDVGAADGTERDLVPPVNDAFASATVIGGEEGSVAVDLLQATAEPGEPVFDARTGRPAASVWYAWTAPADGAYRFRVPPLPNDYRQRDDIARYDRVHVYTGDAIASLSEVASALWHATLFAEAGATYRIRVSGVSRAAPVDLRWSSNDRPVNDDFAEAIVLEGESGSVEGSTAGATLEPGEAFGEMAATTWFRWIAPEDGRWEFHAPGRSVLVFAGDDLLALRLVGQLPSSIPQLQAGAGREYRIAVAETGISGLGGDYSLRWAGINRTGLRNDMLDAAESLDPEPTSERVVTVDNDGTVEPGEPTETGVRTKWWSWKAPEDGLHTWRLSDAGGEQVPSYPKMRVTLWTGTGVDDLELVARIGPGGPFETLLDAVGGETYWIAAGLPNGDVAAYELYWASGKLSWGATPDNDRVAGATALSGASGSVSGSNAFATGDRGERSGVLGRSTVWWTYEAEESGWVRFVVKGGSGPWALTVHRDAADGLGGLDVVASSVWQRSEDGAVEVLFNAKAGARYTVALGVREGGRGGEFTLEWEGSDAPAWLRYAGQLADGGRDSDGDTVELRGLLDLAMHPGGGALHLASELGVQVFARDPANGRLDYLQLLETELNLRHGSLVWDARRDRLLVDDCGSWQAFEQDGDGPELRDGVAVTVTEDPGTCGHTLLLDAGGSDLYRAHAHRLEHFAVEEEGGLRFVSATDVLAVGAVLANDGGHLYVASHDRLVVFERDVESGTLTRADFEASMNAPASGPVPLAVTDDDAHLFVFDNSGERVNLFSLADATNPERLARLGRFWSSPNALDRCRFADAREEVPAVDVFCPGVAFSARWDAEAAELEGTDSLTVRQTDRFNSPPMPDFDVPVDLAVSPDDDHLYVATLNHGILVFARDAAPVTDGGTGAPDLAIQHVWASSTAAFTGATFRLAAVVRNRGGGRAGATLRFYRSADLTITTADTEVGSVSVGDLPASGTRSRSVEVTAPSTAGTYHYGACVDTVSGESDGTNNCSGAVTVTVAEGDPDLVVDAVSADPSEVDPEGDFTLSVVVRNQGYGESDATTLRYYRSDDESVSSEDTEVGTDAVATLPPGSESALSIAIDAPADAGTVHYGACVDAVSGESDTDNNCSAGAAVTVRE